MPENKYPHLILNNPLGETNHVNTRIGGNFNNKEEKKKVVEKDYSYQKERLKENLNTFRGDREYRKENRTIKLPHQLEYIEIHFFTQFNKDFGKDDYYEKEFGLIPVSYRAFNKTVLFYINDERLFSSFIHLIEQFYNSPSDDNPADHEYNTLPILHSFEFLSSTKIKNISNDRIILSFTELKGNEEWREIARIFHAYLEGKEIGFSKLYDGVWELSNAHTFIDEIVDNFDVIQKIQSIPPVRVTPGAFGTPKFGWDFRTIPNENLPVVGVIDSGIDAIDPLNPLLVGNISILDRYRGIGSGHGTSVASLVAFGEDIVSRENPKESSANLFSIQVLYGEEGNFSYNKLREAIINVHREHNVRIFNLSVCDECGFEYNADYSEYAKMLDELAYEHDLLIFIAAGNLSRDYRNYMKSEQGNNTPLIDYPNHFYNEFDNDYSQPTNIGSPAESMNNITVGAIASNKLDNHTDLTDSHDLPAYYSRKYHVDYARKINGGDFNKNQKNKNIFKPDILMPGGDWLTVDSKMIVLGRGQAPDDFYLRLSGTSLATPLAANLAAKIITKYPDINMQSVKALLINSAQSTKIDKLVSTISERCKDAEAQRIYECPFNHLARSEKMKISSKFNHHRLAKYIEGHGVPDEERCLISTDKRVTFIIEGEIKARHFQVKHIKLPDYLLESKKQSVLRITGTICFKFPPVKDDSIAYNPLHISFNFLNAQESSQVTAFVLSNKEDEVTENRPFSTEARDNLLHFKSDRAWSEHYGFINRQLFSNTQRLERVINKNDLVTLENEIAIAVRCIGKKHVDKNIKHPYSLVVSIEEYENIGLEGNLYTGISANNEVRAITELDAGIDIESGG